MLTSLLIFLLFHLLNLSSSSATQFLSSFSASNSPWQPSHNQVLLSPNSVFTAGFHPAPTSTNLFIFSVWYSNLTDPSSDSIWSANWNSPVNQSASLIITPNGELQLLDSPSGRNVWQHVNSNSTRLQLKEDGNLVFGSWESFGHPTDTITANQSITSDLVLRSRNGKFSFTGRRNLVFNDSDTYYSLKNGLKSLNLDGRLTQDQGDPLLSSDSGHNRTRKLTLGNDGNLQVFSFSPHRRVWVVVWEAIIGQVCKAHGLCGPGYICYSDGFTESNYSCVCPPGYKRSFNSDSCERKTAITDFAKSRFLRLDYITYADKPNQRNLSTSNYAECELKCLEDHTCLGFGYKYDGTGYCVLQLHRLLNGYWSQDTEMAFYLRVDWQETDQTNFTGMSEIVTTMCPTNVSFPDPPKEHSKMALNIIIICTLFTIEILSGALLFRAFLRRYVKYRDMAQTMGLGILPMAGPKRFSISEIKTATNDFAEENLIGKGAYSDVYMGKLQDGRPVAIKSLKNVTGGDTDFWSEVTTIARMHHLNLVRLWGFCNEKGRKILVYEHVPNGSLDKYLFNRKHVGLIDQGNSNEIDPNIGIEQKPILDWNIRYKIALGVARAIAYLHEECLEWVLHCDIKPENILLGDNFCPKVADFGLSKLRKKEQTVNTSGIHGTPGYLAPEWMQRDSKTPKIDVYSFGMVLLEIVSGRRNMEQENSSFLSHERYFPKWVFETAIEERRLDEILDSQIKDSYDCEVHFQVVERMVKTAMWCLQEKPEMRPSMGKVTKMLEGTVEIMEPPKPTIFFLGASGDQ